MVLCILFWQDKFKMEQSISVFWREKSFTDRLIFENSNKQKQVLKKQLAQQENLFQSLQQRAFNGEL